MDDKAIVRLVNISKRFPGVQANDSISLDIRQGEVFALLGENGAGKSTLMSILFGLYQPDSGEIYIRGEKVSFSSARDATELGIGMVHQHFKLVQNYTIAENIVLGQEPKKRRLKLFPVLDKKRANDEIRALSIQYGLEVDPGQLISDVNVSVQQRVEILKMLYREANILIFDEPTALLAPQEIDFLLGIILELKKHGKTVILITHKLEEIKRVADRCAVLRSGRLVDVFDVASTDTKTLAASMVGREIDFSIAKKPMTPGDTILSVENLSVKTEDKVTVVNDVSFQVRRGEIFAVAGVSGNGQVELVEAIYGMTRPSSGKVLFKGEDFSGRSVRDHCRNGMSYIPEDRQLTGMIPDMTLAENLAIKSYDRPPFSRRHVLDREAFSRHATDLIDAYDIRSGSGKATMMRSMSGGNQQKAIVAREIDLGGELLIFVQPTRGLDIAACHHIHQQILRERDKGNAILLVSLELDEVMQLADTIGVIFRGEMRRIERADRMTQEEVGRYMMGVLS
ncbi:MAG TPA: ABC transporter ATP-binding protein [Bacillota bacterium]|nr:ABC transporter ATP-binding protein [Bacillota bacterium]